MNRIVAFTYGVISYAIFFGTFLYAIGFLNNLGVPKSIDSGTTGPFAIALLVNATLLGVFAVQHSVMARPGFKKWWTQFVPKPVERSTYTLFSSLALILMFWQWRPMGGVIWEIEGEAARTAMLGLYGVGILTVLVSTFLINHFDLFGLRQVWLYLRKREYTSPRFVMPGPYKLVRHPLYVGWLLTFWAAPTMTVAHLVAALLTTGYILIAIQLEERDLVAEHGESYESYRRQVPMLIPIPRANRTITEAVN